MMVILAIFVLVGTRVAAAGSLALAFETFGEYDAVLKTEAVIPPQRSSTCS